MQSIIQALELLAFVSQHPATWQGVRDRAARLQAQLEAELPADVAATARRQGKNRQLTEVMEMLGDVPSGLGPAA